MDQKPIALWDINGDGLDELIHLRPYTEERSGKLYLRIVGYSNGIQTLYDDYVINLPGAESCYSVFLADDQKIYSLTAKECNGHVIQFDVDGDKLSAETLADSSAHHLAEPEEAVCHIDGKDVTYQEFDSYRSSKEDKVTKYLLINYQNSKNAEDISLSYDEACRYLKEHFKSSQAQSSTEASQTSRLENGLWVKYSPQAELFETYVFTDGIIECKEYRYDTGSIEEFNSQNTHAFMTYQVDDDSVTIRDNNGAEWTWYFTDDEDIMERTYQDFVGTDTFTVTEGLYRHDSFPSYETVKEQSRKRG